MDDSSPHVRLGRLAVELRIAEISLNAIIDTYPMSADLAGHLADVAERLRTAQRADERAAGWAA